MNEKLEDLYSRYKYIFNSAVLSIKFTELVTTQLLYDAFPGVSAIKDSIDKKNLEAFFVDLKNLWFEISIKCMGSTSLHEIYDNKRELQDFLDFLKDITGPSREQIIKMIESENIQVSKLIIYAHIKRLDEIACLLMESPVWRAIFDDKTRESLIMKITINKNKLLQYGTETTGDLR